MQTVCERKRELPVPYVRYEDWPEYRVFEDPLNKNVVLSLNTLGVKVSWDGISFVEIVLSKKHQSNVSATNFKESKTINAQISDCVSVKHFQVCGLCGNFNGNAEDDLLPKHGSTTTSVIKFAKSWRYGNQCYASLESNKC